MDKIFRFIWTRCFLVISKSGYVGQPYTDWDAPTLTHRSVIEWHIKKLSHIMNWAFAREKALKHGKPS
jgi:hypothetical protein